MTSAEIEGLNKQLNPCPFCGGQAELQANCEGNEFWVYCYHCDVETYAYDREAEAIEAWNTRANEK